MNLEKQIEKLRHDLITMGMKLGFNHPKVQNLSEKLDKVLNMWQKEQTRKQANKIMETKEFYLVTAM